MENKPVLNLVGVDGNAFALLGVASRRMKEIGKPKEEIQKVFAEATAGDYHHLLRTLDKYFRLVMSGD